MRGRSLNLSEAMILCSSGNWKEVALGDCKFFRLMNLAISSGFRSKLVASDCSMDPLRLLSSLISCSSKLKDSLIR